VRFRAASEPSAWRHCQRRPPVRTAFIVPIFHLPQMLRQPRWFLGFVLNADPRIIREFGTRLHHSHTRRSGWADPKKPAMMLTMMTIGCCCLALLLAEGATTGARGRSFSPAVSTRIIRRRGGGGNLSPPRSTRSWSKLPATPTTTSSWTSSSSSSSTRQIQEQRHEASKEAINSFLTRDSRNKFISKFVVSGVVVDCMNGWMDR
jgi:hypothetical protein